jgi:hypothetical protein
MSKQFEESNVRLETSETTKLEWTEPEMKKIDMIDSTKDTTGNSVDAAGSTSVPA